ncbi:hypothetical protein C8J57DRAFT_1480330 [Mycena rebaudengoi]|nr:hypothetical protein C8J57DRAFT_1480330 [Mycena rebaudengoi]
MTLKLEGLEGGTQRDGPNFGRKRVAGRKSLWDSRILDALLLIEIRSNQTARKSPCARSDGAVRPCGGDGRRWSGVVWQNVTVSVAVSLFRGIPDTQLLLSDEVHTRFVVWSSWQSTLYTEDVVKVDTDDAVITRLCGSPGLDITQSLVFCCIPKTNVSLDNTFLGMDASSTPRRVRRNATTIQRARLASQVSYMNCSVAVEWPMHVDTPDAAVHTSPPHHMVVNACTGIWYEVGKEFGYSLRSSLAADGGDGMKRKADKCGEVRIGAGQQGMRATRNEERHGAEWVDELIRG